VYVVEHIDEGTVHVTGTLLEHSWFRSREPAYRPAEVILEWRGENAVKKMQTRAYVKETHDGNAH
jgi:hypothetical protein